MSGSSSLVPSLLLQLLLISTLHDDVNGLLTPATALTTSSRHASSLSLLPHTSKTNDRLNRAPVSSHQTSSYSSSSLNLLSTTDIEEALASKSNNAKAPEHYDAVIVGGGPAGLLSAIMMARQLPYFDSFPSNNNKQSTTNKPRIVVYDRLPPPPPPNSDVYSTKLSKYYLLGLGHRGQRALRHFDAWESVEKASVAVLGRRGWQPGKTNEEDGVVSLAKKSVTSRVLARDKLVGVLKEVIENRYGDVVDLKYGYQVDPITFGEIGDQGGEEGSGSNVELQVSRCVPLASLTSGEDSEEAEECSIEEDDAGPKTISTSFLIGSDGAARTIANKMESLSPVKSINPLKRLFGKKQQLPFHVKRYEDDNPRVYKSVPITFPAHWPHDLNYSARSTDSRVTFEALPSDSKGNYCALLLMKPDDALAAANCDPKLLREFFNEQFPQFGKLLSDEVMADVAGKGASALPSFRFAGPRLHEGGRTVLLGDCVHTVKPYFGLGANTALEDVQILSDILAATPDPSNNLHSAIREFTNHRAGDSKALVTLSRGLDRPGKLGTMRFVLPLILDGMFHKMAPKLFAPGIFGMFQKEDVGFQQIVRRKRLDRVVQSMVILSFMSAAGVGARYLVKTLAKALGVGDAVVSGGLIALLGAVGVARKTMAKAKET